MFFANDKYVFRWWLSSILSCICDTFCDASNIFCYMTSAKRTIGLQLLFRGWVRIPWIYGEPGSCWNIWWCWFCFLRTLHNILSMAVQVNSYRLDGKVSSISLLSSPVLFIRINITGIKLCLIVVLIFTSHWSLLVVTSWSFVYLSLNS